MPEESGKRDYIWDKVRNEDIRSRLGQLAVVSRVEKKTEWLRKVEGMTDDRMVKKVFVENVPGRRPRRRSRKRWADDLKEIKQLITELSSTA